VTSNLGLLVIYRTHRLVRRREQCALRAFEDFDSLHIDQVDVDMRAGYCIDSSSRYSATFGNGAVVDCD